MKYLKTFEKNVITLKDLNSGVALYSPYLAPDNIDMPNDTKFKIGDLVKFKNANWKNIYKIKYYYINDLEYFCFIVLYPNENFSKTWVIEDKIELATQEDLEKLEIELNLRRYNL